MEAFGDGFTIYSVKTKNQRNPISRIQIGKGGSAINEFEFYQTETTLQLAVVSQDGYLRIFDYHAMEIIALMKSYFGGLLCLSWSSDGKYIATGGEDDLLTVYSVLEKRVICRGQGHKSWISRVAFDSFATAINDTGSSSSLDDMLNGITESTEELRNNIVYTTASVNKYGYDDSMIYQNTNGVQHVTPIVNIVEPSITSATSQHHQTIEHSPFEHGTQFTPSQSQISIAEMKNNSISNNSMNLCGLNASSSQNSIHGGYRIGTVGHDTQLLLWDINDDILTSPMTTIINPKIGGENTTVINVGLSPSPMDGGVMGASTSSEGYESSRGAPSADAPSTSSSSSTKSRFKKFHKRGFSFGNRFGRVSNNSSSNQNGYLNGLSATEQSNTIFGSKICPKMNQVPIIEPLISKKIAHERLTVLIFREECIVTGFSRV
uniref:Uncharacterized protein n=1 Tax=Panagrolaimus sp. PS1159 TaxID=55785 RepID=A0AC35G3R7_9BILA